ncbi:hypothetical protein AUQ37_03025 [Candidatus Methanomethylophilus sp. 1R26]|nr:hypothetical protein AUQ37_03025 [Candidatus Methanomethylophilus sp. 1R26]
MPSVVSLRDSCLCRVGPGGRRVLCICLGPGGVPGLGSGAGVAAATLIGWFSSVNGEAGL